MHPSFRGKLVPAAVVSVCWLPVLCGLIGCPSTAGIGAGGNLGGRSEQDVPLPGDPALSDPPSTDSGGVDADTHPACRGPEDCGDGNACTSDDCVDGRCRYINNTAPCDDRDACTLGDTCKRGTCVGLPTVCSGGGTCRDGTCTGGDDSAPPDSGDDTLVLDLPNGVTMELVRIAAGTFMMGTASTDFAWLEHSRPVHGVSVAKAFYIGKYEVTQSQWRALMKTDPSRFVGDDRPVDSVSWNDAVTFADTLAALTGYSIRLPSEAEWEYACRAGTTTEYYFGDDVGELDAYAWHEGNSEFATHDVGTKQPNAWGLFDMHGNVWEWCDDLWHDGYTNAPSDGSSWTTDEGSTYRVLRGGSWEDAGASLHRSAARRGVRQTGLRGNQGFRIVADM